MLLGRTGCVAGVLCVLFGVFGCGKATVSAPAATGNAVESKENTGALFKKACSECHTVSRVEQYSGKEPWKGIVDRMIVKHGAKVSAENAGRLVVYLDKTYPRK